MQKWIRVLIWSGISLVFLFCLLVGGLQTRYVKDKLRLLLLDVSGQMGISLQIGKIKGEIPLRWVLRDLVIEPTPGDRIEIPELRFSIAFLPLLRGELAFKRIVVRDAVYSLSNSSDFSLPNIDFPMAVSCKDLFISKMHLENKLTKTSGIYSIRGKGYLYAHSVKFLSDIFVTMPSFQDATARIYTAGSKSADHITYTLDAHLPIAAISPLFISPFDADIFLSANVSSSWKGAVDVALTALTLKNFQYLDGKIRGDLALDASFSKEKARIGFFTQNLTIEGHPFESFETEFIASQKEGLWQGTGTFAFSQENILLRGKAIFDYADRFLCLKDISSEGTGFLFDGHLDIHFLPFTMDGGIYGYISDLSPFAKWAKEERLGGSIAVSARFKEDGESKATLVTKNFDCDHLLIQELQVHAHLENLWQNPRGTLSLEAERMYSPGISLTALSASTTISSDPWNFSVRGQGLWKDPLSFSILGTWFKNSLQSTLSLKEIKANVFTHPIALQAPCSIKWEGGSTVLSPSSWTLDKGTLYAEARLSKNESAWTLKTAHFPLDLLALSYPQFTLTGTCSLDAFFSESLDKPKGTCNVVLEKASILQTGKSEPLQAKGYLLINLEDDKLQLHSNLKATGHQFLDWTATVPVQGSLFPFALCLDKEGPLSSEILIEGHLEEIFDFIDIGSHRTSGLISCHLYLSKTLLSPSLLGKIELQQGEYENYMTGTLLKNIEGIALAENNQILLSSFYAKDEDSGAVFASGHLNLDLRRSFPYDVFIHFKDLSTLHYDSFTSNFTGPLHVSGTMKRMHAEGDLEVPEARFYIPDALPVHIPALPVTYIHQPHHLKKNQAAAPSFFPIDLNIELTADNKVFVRGRGLNSEWNGRVRLEGTNQEVIANGSLQLLKGEFAFSGKIFSLTQGEITFAHKTTQEAFLSLSGTLNLPDATITAMLRGPLSSPQLSFHSVPQMPTSSILARILFNKDISEISAFQAIQIAQALVTLSGGAGPDVLETIRKSLGVDRLNIVSSQSDPDAISIQIGKYLTRGVMVTLSQSADSSQVIVEVDLSKGFIFQAETQEEEEGKFTLKWNRNY